MREPERYESLPGLVELPAWLWRRASRRVRWGLLASALGVAAAVAVLAPRIDDGKAERAESDRRARAEQRARRVRELQAEQRPRTIRASDGAAPVVGVRERERLVATLTAAVAGDARRRVREGALEGPVRRGSCEPYPRTVGGVAPERDPTVERGSYACVAVTSDLPRATTRAGGVIGHPYRALVDFTTGRITFCKITGSPGPARDPLVTVPRACGGR